MIQEIPFPERIPVYLELFHQLLNFLFVVLQKLELGAAVYVS